MNGKKFQLQKQLLQKQLSEIIEQEKNELIKKHYPKFKALEGLCYKVKNCYSCPEKSSDYCYGSERTGRFLPMNFI